MSRKAKNFREHRAKLHSRLASIIYNNIKDYIESDDEITYIEVSGILDRLKEYFAHNSLLEVTDIRIKRDIAKDFKPKKDDKDIYCKKCREKIENAKNFEVVPICNKCAKNLYSGRGFFPRP